MTSRNRRSRGSRGTRRRTGRNVWVNVSLANTVVAGVASIDVLQPASDFMTFDTTIVGIVIPDLTLVFDNGTGLSNVRTRWALQTAPSTMDADDFQVPDSDSIGPPWMYVGGMARRIPSDTAVTFDYVDQSGGPIRVKSKRRFRENDSTLFLVFQTVVSGGSFSNGFLNGMIRTLIHIP